MPKYVVYQTEEYQEWFDCESLKSQRQILNRLSNIELEGHFGHYRSLGTDLFELKFNDGRSIYYTHIPEIQVLLLLGGNKNGQDKDIKKAKSILKRIEKD